MEKEMLATQNNEENLEYLNQVKSNMKAMEGQLEKVSSEFNVLQDEMKKSLLDNKKNTILLNARQTLMMLQNEYDKKYSHRDYIRRKLVGILQAGDLNTVKSSTMESIGEESLINNPDYWLAPALLALCAWYNNDKKLASKAITEALHRNAEMTSLLLCFIHLRANRIDTATRWLNKYLDMQIPREIDNKISLVIEALTNGIFPYTMQQLALNKIDLWLKDLYNYDKYKDIYEKNITLWKNYFKEAKTDAKENQFGYINDYIESGNKKIDFISKLNNISSINISIKNILESTENKEEIYTSKIDKIITKLISFNDENEDILLEEMYKNQCIIDSYGDDTLASELYIKNKEYIKTYNDLYTELTKIAIYDNDINQNSKKLAISINGFFITEAYKQLLNYDNIVNEEKSIINIDEIKLETTNGSNELELLNNLEQEENKKYQPLINEIKIFNIINIVSIVGLIFGILLLFKIPILGLIFVLLFLGYNGYTIITKINERNKKQTDINIIKENNRILLLNIISEVVDYHFLLEDIKENIDEFVNSIQNLNPQNYLSKDMDNNYRDILIGDKNE